MAPTDHDRDLYPAATGAALAFASAHTDVPESAAPFTLYGSWFCPFVQRVWITLHLKSIPHRYVEINPYHKDPDFLKRNPRGLVPTLAINDVTNFAGPDANDLSSTSKLNGEATSTNTKEKILYESTIVATYLNTLHPDPHPLLSPNPYTSARQQIWIDYASSKIIPAFYRFMQHTPSKPYSLESCREEFNTHLLTWIAAAHPTGPFFGGREISMVDITLIPWAMRIFLLDHYKTPGGSGVGQVLQSEEAIKKVGNEETQRELWERWWSWGKAVEECKSVRETMSERSKYVDAYKRYAEDVAGSEVAVATRDGRGLP